MKISVCGKGGSGKSCIVALLAKGVRARGYSPLVVDSDESNSGLYRVLGFEHPPIPLMELVGGKTELKKQMGSKLSSNKAGHKAAVLAQSQIAVADLPQEHVVKSDGIALVSVGKILQSLEGCACPMGVLSREFLKKLCLQDNEVAIVDMEAGVEHFGRGVDTSIDSVLVVVEPSFESLQLAERIQSLAIGSGVVNVWSILNKVDSDEVASKLRGRLGDKGLEVIGAIHSDPNIFDACLDGRPIPEGRAVDEMGEVVDILISQAKSEG